MSSPNTPKKKPLVNLPFPILASDQQSEVTHNQFRPKPEQYADKTWPPPRGTRRSFGKR